MYCVPSPITNTRGLLCLKLHFSFFSLRLDPAQPRVPRPPGARPPPDPPLNLRLHIRPPLEEEEGDRDARVPGLHHIAVSVGNTVMDFATGSICVSKAV